MMMMMISMKPRSVSLWVASKLHAILLDPNDDDDCHDDDGDDCHFSRECRENLNIHTLRIKLRIKSGSEDSRNLCHPAPSGQSRDGQS